MVPSPEDQAVPRLHVHRSPDTSRRLLDVQRSLPGLDQLVAATHRLSRNHVYLRRVLVHAD